MVSKKQNTETQLKKEKKRRLRIKWKDRQLVCSLGHIMRTVYGSVIPVGEISFEDVGAMIRKLFGSPGVMRFYVDGWEVWGDDFICDVMKRNEVLEVKEMIVKYSEHEVNDNGEEDHGEYDNDEYDNGEYDVGRESERTMEDISDEEFGEHGDKHSIDGKFNEDLEKEYTAYLEREYSNVDKEERDNSEKSDYPESDIEIPERTYTSENSRPLAGDLKPGMYIAYKTLELNPKTYEPNLSRYKEAKVVSAGNLMVRLEHLFPPVEIERALMGLSPSPHALVLNVERESLQKILELTSPPEYEDNEAPFFSPRMFVYVRTLDQEGIILQLHHDIANVLLIDDQKEQKFPISKLDHIHPTKTNEWCIVIDPDHEYFEVKAIVSKLLQDEIVIQTQNNHLVTVLPTQLCRLKPKRKRKRSKDSSEAKKQRKMNGEES